MATTFFGVATSVADNSSDATSPQTITPPGSMVAGDLVVVFGQNRAASGTLSMSTTGGQSWTSGTQYNQTTDRHKVFWCRFNGTWSVNPQVTFGSSTCNTAVMLVFRPATAENEWYESNAVSNTAVTAPGSPYTITITGVTLPSAEAVAIGYWGVIAANTFSSLSGTGWSQTSLSAQYRNTAGSDHSLSFAYNFNNGATNNVSLNESASTAGHKLIVGYASRAIAINVSDTTNVTESTRVEAWTYFGTQTSTVDPTGVSFFGSGNVVALNYSTEFTCPGTGNKTLKGIYFWGKSGGGTAANVRLAVYDNSTTVPSLIAQGSAQFSVSSTTAAWIGHTAFVDFGGSPITPTLVGGTKYRLGWTNETNDSQFGYVSGASDAWKYIVADETGGFSATQTFASFTNSSYDQSTLFAIVNAAAGAPEPNVSDTTTITESRTVTLPDALAVSQSETSTVTESAALDLTRNISSSETSTISESRSVVVSDPAISVSETSGVTESANLDITGGVRNVNVSDTSTITETRSVALSDIRVEIDDDEHVIAMSESRTVAVSAPSPNVSDTTTISESRALSMSDMAVSGSETSTVTESVGAKVGDPQINVSETSGVSESATTQIEGAPPSTPNINVSDTSSLTESRTVEVSGAQPNVSDTSNMTESRTASISASQISASETSSISESVGASIVLNVSRSETTTMSESRSALVGDLYINKSETTTITESIGRSLVVQITVSETVTIAEIIGLTSAAWVISINKSETTTITDGVIMHVDTAPTIAMKTMRTKAWPRPTW